MTVRFEERAPYERGFAEVFDKRLAPELERAEGIRLALRRRGRILFAVSAGIGAAIGLSIAMLAPDLTIGFFAFILPFGMGLGIGAVFMFTAGDKWTEGLADLAIPVVCDFIGDLTYDRKAEAGFPTERMRELGIIGGYDRARVGDRLDGRYRDTPFTLVDAALQERYSDKDGKTRHRTVWGGLLFRIGVPVPAPGRILIARDDGDTMNSVMRFLARDRGRGMPRVPFDDDPPFEAAFEVHADDPEAARAFLDPGFRQALMSIGESESTNRSPDGVTAGFEGDDFFLALRRRGAFLSVGAADRPAAALAEELHGVFDDIAVAYRIIDRLHGDRAEADSGTTAPEPEAPPPPVAPAA